MNMTLKDQINKCYSEALSEMENGADINKVRDLLLKAAEGLNEYAKVDESSSITALAKAKLLIELCSLIRKEKSYSTVYIKLTKKSLPVKTVQESKTDLSKSKTDDKDTQNIQFNWDNIPTISFDDVAGLEDVKDEVKKKVIQPLIRPDLYEGYDKKNGGGLLLYGPPGTGKTMIAAAIAKEIGAKFCCIGASDLLSSGVGNSEKAIAELFKEARAFKCSVIFFDEVEALCPATTHAQTAKQVRSELLRQMQGLDSYGKETGNILYLIGATNKPWDVDPAFVRPGRFGTRVYVGLPDHDARKFMIESKLKKIENSGKVKIDTNIDFEKIVEKTLGFNGADMTYLLDKAQEISIDRTYVTGEKSINQNDFDEALNKITSSVQQKDIEKLQNWKEING